MRVALDPMASPCLDVPSSVWQACKERERQRKITDCAVSSRASGYPSAGRTSSQSPQPSSARRATKTQCLHTCIKQPLGLSSVVVFQHVLRISRGRQKTKQNENSSGQPDLAAASL